MMYGTLFKLSKEQRKAFTSIIRRNSQIKNSQQTLLSLFLQHYHNLEVIDDQENNIPIPELI